ncbi:MAG: hypothetical protein LBC99_00880 [Spirochaetota bacterium]|jgi:hypothetical protein|nr:hypothetical protein [Spirochaetota bacterium]
MREAVVFFLFICAAFLVAQCGAGEPANDSSQRWPASASTMSVSGGNTWYNAANLNPISSRSGASSSASGSSGAGFPGNVDPASRHIYFEYYGRSGWYPKQFSLDAIAVVSYTSGVYSIAISAKEYPYAAADTIHFSADGSTDDDWESRNYYTEVRFSGLVLSTDNAALSIYDDGKISGVFKATFTNVCPENETWYTILRRGVIIVPITRQNS